MNFGAFLFQHRGPSLAAAARAAEDLGFESVWMGEHISFPAEIKSNYPYDPSGLPPVRVDAPIVDPITAFAFLAVDEETATLTAIFDVVLVAFHDDRSAIARYAAIGELKMVAGFGAATDEKRHLCYANVTPRTVGRHNLENGFGQIWNCIGHLISAGL